MKAKKRNKKYKKGGIFPPKIQQMINNLEPAIYDGMLDEVTITPYTQGEYALQSGPLGMGKATGGLDPVYPIFDLLTLGFKTPLTAGAKALQTGVKKAPSTINPRYFKPAEDLWYRQVGKSAIDDIAESKVIRERGEDILNSERVYNDRILRMKGIDPDTGKPFENYAEQLLGGRRPKSPYFQKGELFWGWNRKPGKGKPGRGGDADSEYLIESLLGDDAFHPAHVKGMFPDNPDKWVGDIGILKPKPELRDPAKFNLYKRNWWSGYKPVTGSNAKKPLYQEGGKLPKAKKGQDKETPLDKFFKTAPKGTKIDKLEYDDNGMSVFTMSDGSVVKQRHSQTMGYPYDAGAIEKAYNDKTQYQNAMKSFSDSLSLANFSTDGEFPLYDPDWDRPGTLAGNQGTGTDEGKQAQSDLAKRIVKNSNGSIKGYYPGDEPGYFMYGYEPILRWGNDPNKKLDGNYRGQDLGYYGYESDHDPYKRTDFTAGLDLMYNQNTNDFDVPVDTYESRSVPMGQGNYIRRTYTNPRGDKQTLLNEHPGGDWLQTNKIIQTVDEAGSENIDKGYHRVDYPFFPPPKVRPVYREPVSRVSLPPKTARLPMPKVDLQIRDPLPKFYGRDMNKFGDIIYDTSFGQFVTTKDQNRLKLLRSNQAGSRYKNNMDIAPMLDQDFQTLFRNKIEGEIRSQRGQFSENRGVIRANKNKVSYKK